MRLPHFKKKFLAGALAAGMVMGAGGIAAAYFHLTGINYGSGTVGNPAHWAVTNVHATGYLFPGTGTNALIAQVQNPTQTATTGGNLRLRGMLVMLKPTTTTSNPTCAGTNFTFVTTTGKWTITGGTALHPVKARHVGTTTTPVIVAPGQYFTGTNTTATNNSGSNALGGLRIQMITNGTQEACIGVTAHIEVFVT